jgi:hypothetical protein
VTLDVPAFTREDWSLYLSLMPSVKMRRAGVHWVLAGRTVPYNEFSDLVTSGEFRESAARLGTTQTLLGLSEASLNDALSCRVDLERRNATSVPIVAHRETCLLKIVPEEQIRAIFDRGDWPQFRTEFPKALGVMHCSLPGYSQDGKSALLHVSWLSGALTRWEELVYVEKGPRGWVRHAGWKA